MKLKPIIFLIMLGGAVYLLVNIHEGKKTPNVWQGYVEVENTLVAPLDSTIITQVFVKRGDTVKAGANLFAMDQTEAKNNLAAAQASLAQSEAQLENLMTGDRPQEISVKKSNIDDASAASQLALENYNRQKDLFQNGYVTQRAVETVKAAYDQAQAKLAAAKKELGVAALPARQKEIEAAIQQREQTKAALATAQWKLDRTLLKAPVAGLVEDVIRYTGETASPQQPVVSILPPEKTYLRFFVPEEDLSKFKQGGQVSVHCDGCADNLSAKITYIAPRAEYTPPVIYSVGSREKLVFMLEAVPQGDMASFHAGQPVDIRPAR